MTLICHFFMKRVSLVSIFIKKHCKSTLFFVTYHFLEKIMYLCTPLFIMYLNGKTKNDL
jgi:ABC-type multidrug transport system ATPase subunit